MDVRRMAACVVTATALVGASIGISAQPASASEAYPEVEWADPTGSLLCGIKQIDSDNERSWKYGAHCTQLRVMNTPANRKACRWNDWAGPIVGPMGGRWLCAHDPYSQPFADAQGWSGNLWWTEQVAPKLVTGRYGYAKGQKLLAMPAGTQVELGNITCVQGKASVTCTDRRVKKSFTAYTSGKTTWKGIKGKVRTWGDVQY